MIYFAGCEFYQVLLMASYKILYSFYFRIL
jgi:hypothetical protein